jgi:hypothetical protein
VSSTDELPFDAGDWDDIRMESSHPLWNAPERHPFWFHCFSDANNWLGIPDFGVQPATVEWEGFSIPLFGRFIGGPARAPQRRVVACVYDALRDLREIARARFGSLSALKEANYRFVEIAFPYEDDDERQKRARARPTADEFWAFQFDSVTRVGGSGELYAALSVDPASTDQLAAMASALRSVVWMLANEPNEASLLRMRAQLSAKRRYEPYRQAEAFARHDWVSLAGSYGNNKSAFARDYSRLIAQKFSTARGDPLKVTEKTIREVWLRDLNEPKT